ncbi:AraC family transcriptional regulator [Azorhizobium oxalatiphilum]|uniref:AraC family transcriptional regulator n=2 Tax=Azorhizobium oxalatiphilum TaxID=980631 RepID=A0A917BM61_9HYPH|nr:AraC family transcriptional regulator [Azorhizobium oxalatiphilum]
MLKSAVGRHAQAHANADGLTLTPVPGLRMMHVTVPRGELHSIYRPLICLILQGTKRLTIGNEMRLVTAGQSVIVSADLPVVGQIVTARPEAPYMAIAVELEMSLLREVTAQAGAAPGQRLAAARTVFTEDTDAHVLGCAARLMELLARPEAVPLLRPGLMMELHYWLLAGRHGAELRALAAPESHASRLAAAIAILREAFRERVPVERLARAAGMGVTAFHQHFKRMTSLSPGQFQQRLRLIEARRLMLDEGHSATQAAFAVGYESVSQFTREYGRLFQLSPRRDAVRARAEMGEDRSAEPLMP